MSVAQWHDCLLVGYAAASVFVFVMLQFFVKAAYGKHKADQLAWWWGPGVPTRVSWIVMEAPSSIGFALIYFAGARAFDAAPLVLLLMWQAHYFQRSFIYPFIRSVRPGDTTPLLIPAMAFVTNLGISFLNATILSWTEVRADYGAGWLTDPRFLAGAALFVAGYHINRKADRMLAALRKPGETGYRIPRGWLYEKISCPNYFGECLIWAGWAIATWSSAGVVFVLWTLANLLPRALSTHRWYREKFPDYPSARRAVIPGVL
ncbi:DUF1295 domain-containing protein [Fontimonas sp. SYSU GA230001]|uniref:DUF1295 domain-containing protein n=1 Tax=Fontimonas sp. SYSU GA230001 TaxID=3142450 RepID=UPI0032B3DCE1